MRRKVSTSFICFIDLSLIKANCSRRSCRGEIVWTNFHCLLCLGLSGFFLFWTAILLRYSARAPDIQSGQETLKTFNKFYANILLGGLATFLNDVFLLRKVINDQIYINEMSKISIKKRCHSIPLLIKILRRLKPPNYS